MYTKNCFRVSPLVLAPLLFVGNVQAASIPCELVINQPGLVYMAAGKGQDALAGLQVSGRWWRSAGYQFGYVDDGMFAPIINGNGTQGMLTFQDGALVDFALRNKGGDGIFGTMDDTLFRLGDASRFATQIYSDPLSGSSANYRKLTLLWDINSDQMTDLTVSLKSTRGAGMHFVASPASVPVPAALWLLGSGIVGLTAFLRRRKNVLPGVTI